jgi:DNA-binding NarL/FixJ family response regulator
MIMNKIRIALADDQKIFTESLKIYLEEISNQLEVIAMAAEGREIVEIAEHGHPDLILMDVRMPILDGVRATKEIHDKHPDIKILILTTFDDDENVHAAMKYGAAGYLLKEDIDSSVLLNAIKAVSSGSILLSPHIARKLVRKDVHNGGQEKNNKEKIPPWFYSLSKKEKRILKLIAKGLDNREISEEMFLVEQTVKNYISIIYSKLGTRNRGQTIQKAMGVLDYL